MENHHHHGPEGDPADLAELVDLDAEVLHGYLDEATGLLQGLAGDGPHRRILDLGSGTGTGALVLARRFPDAEVTAVDMSAYMLDRLRAKARDLGLADRIRTVQADLDQGWPALGTVDLAWASNSMHHVADPDRVLADLFATLRPGGHLAVAELDAFPRFLPDAAGAALEERCHAVMAAARAIDLPHLGSDWRARLGKAGFTIETERHFAIDLTPPLPSATGRYAQATLRRIRPAVDGHLDAGDLALLDRLSDADGPDSVLRRDDLTVRAARTVWVARRP